MKQWKYPKECVVQVNKNAEGMIYTIGLFAVVVEHLQTPLYDYEVKLEDGSHGKYKEEELDYFFKFGDTLQVMNGGETGKVITFDMKHKQVELYHDDRSYKVYLFSQVTTVDEDFIMDKINEINKRKMIKIPKLANADLHKKILDEKHDIFVRKNSDYGNSFSEQFKEYGLLSAVIRLDDKLRRLKQLLKNEAKVKDESIRDTLLDLSNYADMTVMEIDKESESNA